MEKKNSSGKPYLKSRSTPISSRPIDIRPLRKRILIVCEGIETEPNYFRQFRENSCAPIGIGKDPFSVVCHAVELKQAVELRPNEQYDQVWCVFDRDETSKELFNKAINLAERENIQIAYSNQCFELWFVLHFNYLDTAQTCQDYTRTLKGILKRDYKKNDEWMYDILFSKQEDAIRNAQKLLAQYQPSRPVNDDPSTTVHLLVVELNRST